MAESVDELPQPQTGQVWPNRRPYVDQPDPPDEDTLLPDPTLLPDDDLLPS